MNLALFSITLTAEVLTTIAVVISIVWPQQRIWPPSQQRAWGQYAMLILFNLSAVGVVLLGVLDWGSFVIPACVRLAVGAPLWLAGNLLAQWAIRALGAASTYGGEGALVRRGPYGFSRNPQYLGFIVGLVGWGVMADSLFALVVCVAGVVPLVLVPFAEEPWLLARHGPAYEEYRRAVPRFMSWTW